MVLSRKEIHIGEKLPPLFYGYSHRDFMKDVIYFYPVPINLIVRFGIWVKFRWDKLRSKPSRIDIQIHKGIHRHISKFNFNVDIERRIKLAIQANSTCGQPEKMEGDT